MKDTVKKIMQEKGAVDYIKRDHKWEGYNVYDPIFNRPVGCYGLPEYVLEDAEGNAHRASYDETMEIIDFLIEKEGKA